MIKALLSSHIPARLLQFRGKSKKLEPVSWSWASVLLHSAPFWPERKLSFSGSRAQSWRGMERAGGCDMGKGVLSVARAKQDLTTGGFWPWRQRSVSLNLWEHFGLKSTPPTQLVGAHQRVFSTAPLHLGNLLPSLDR